MVGIQGLGGIPEPKSDGTAKTRNEREAASGTQDVSPDSGGSSGGDGVKISSAAQAAAQLSRVVELTRTESEIRAERVEEARQRIESGEYKNPEVVAQVAERILRILP